MFDTKIKVEIRPATKPGKIKAFADVQFSLSDGEILVRGFAVIQQEGGHPWIGFPELPGRNKFFPIIEANGRIEKAIINAILDAFRESQEEGS
jgi:DNA-binding cell septation regulator SpoVG